MIKRMLTVVALAMLLMGATGCAKNNPSPVPPSPSPTQTMIPNSNGEYPTVVGEWEDILDPGGYIVANLRGKQVADLQAYDTTLEQANHPEGYVYYVQHFQGTNADVSATIQVQDGMVGEIRYVFAYTDVNTFEQDAIALVGRYASTYQADRFYHDTDQREISLTDLSVTGFFNNLQADQVLNAYYETEQHSLRLEGSMTNAQFVGTITIVYH